MYRELVRMKEKDVDKKTHGILHVSTKHRRIGIYMCLMMLLNITAFNITAFNMCILIRGWCNNCKIIHFWGHKISGFYLNWCFNENIKQWKLRFLTLKLMAEMTRWNPLKKNTPQKLMISQYIVLNNIFWYLNFNMKYE